MASRAETVPPCKKHKEGLFYKSRFSLDICTVDKSGETQSQRPGALGVPSTWAWPSSAAGVTYVLQLISSSCLVRSSR